MSRNDATALTTEDEKAVREVPNRIMDAWAAHDADAFAAAFTQDATMILPGVYQQGREAIRGFMAQAFAGPYRDTRVTGTPVALKPLSPGAVLVLTQGGVLAPGEQEPSAERAVRASWLLAKEDGEWLLTAYQNTPANRP